MVTCKDVLSIAWQWKTQISVVLVPLALLPLPLTFQNQQASCGYLLLLMAIFWCGELLPIPVTSLFPLIFLPTLGIMPAKDVTPFYYKDVVMMFTCAIFVAIAIERSGLHKRLALFVLLKMGAEPKWLMAGFMLPSWLLSMWISNTATTAMMLPIVLAVVDQLEATINKSDSDVVNNDDNTLTLPIENPKDSKLENEMEMKSLQNGDIADSNRAVPSNGIVAVDINDNVKITTEMENKDDITHIETVVEVPKPKFILDKCLILGVCHAANTGGISTLTGTSPNMILRGLVDDIWNDKGVDSPISFASWMIYGLPASAILVVCVWIWLQIYFFGWRYLLCNFCQSNKIDPQDDAKKKRNEAVEKVLRAEWEKLGRTKLEEVIIGILFVTMIMLWFFRNPGFMPGWDVLFISGYVSDTVPAVMITVMLFFIPIEATSSHPPRVLMDWKTIQKNFQWSILFIFGGGYSLAEGAARSGLSNFLKEVLSGLGSLPDAAIVLVICIFVTALTQVTSNSATATLIIPILANVAEGIGKNPLYLMLPGTISMSLAFMLPVSTPPNAIAYATGRLTTLDMVKVGFVLNICGVLVTLLATQTWGMAFFKLDQIPWPSNSTTFA